MEPVPSSSFPPAAVVEDQLDRKVELNLFREDYYGTPPHRSHERLGRTQTLAPPPAPLLSPPPLAAAGGCRRAKPPWVDGGGGAFPLQRLGGPLLRAPLGRRVSPAVAPGSGWGLRGHPVRDLGPCPSDPLEAAGEAGEGAWLRSGWRSLGGGRGSASLVAAWPGQVCAGGSLLRLASASPVRRRRRQDSGRGSPGPGQWGRWRRFGGLLVGGEPFGGGRRAKVVACPCGLPRRWRREKAGACPYGQPRRCRPERNLCVGVGLHRRR
ncbi:hypothetical protein BRADI_1g44043v3 [Brachypodium distachyon]|uniref:Uncharacterized protein n=1 Tax=Brachypodium distachyon TaxID=15368 RepID=A0A0Q3L645_BRADI|nr:hypothetical protein BRADI_1g44043v3 [Brachypodium distachyon]